MDNGTDARCDRRVASVNGLQVHPNTIYKVRKTYAELGWEATVQRKKRITPPNPPKVTGEVEAKIIALSCSTPPTGRSTWSLSLLAQSSGTTLY
uniref:helix-turn-helix domain-containing protein n=1 Tax=Paenibacillus albidus TaxID=2041023 RepID=UPI0035CE8AB0